MAFTDENNSGFYMPVAPANNGGFGFGNGDLSWLILLLLCGWGGGFGFGGMGGAAAMGMADGFGLYPWLNNSQNINDGFRDQMLNTNIESIKGSLGDISTQLCGGFAGVNAGIANGFAQAEIAANGRQMANMNQAFGAQTAMMQGFNDISSQFANCCCENRLGIADLKYTVAQENCADRQVISDGIRDLLSATQAQTQAILNQMCEDKIEQKNDTIAQLRSELLYARGQASQDVQTAAIQAGQRALANEVEQYVAPKAVPAYVVQNPNCCNTGVYGCGCAA